MIVGVGGQGTLLAGRILGNAAIARGYDVKMSEVHGMSQRGGSVVTCVRYGEKVYSPVIAEGGADVILAFEQLEAYRYLNYLKKGGGMLMNTRAIDPMPVITGVAEYPGDIPGKIKNAGARVVAADAFAAAVEAGSAKAVNVVLIGLLAAETEIPKDVWMNAVEQTVPPKFLEINKKAFDLGYHLR
jgi:indolepyruvate ferredoxin oxidoreductase beta subunit